LLSKFWKNSSGPLSSSNSISSPFFIYFEWLQTWWMCQLELYKNKI
jgi:hypothetical protein